MKKVISILIMLFMLTTVGFTSLASDLPTSLMVHYFRYDETYTDFNMWVWENEPVARGGIQHNFDPQMVGDYGVYFEINLEESYPGATRIGIIIKQGGWDGYREIGGDRFIELSEVEVIAGVGHAYFVEQDINIGLSQDDLSNNIPDYREKILSATFDTQKRIVAKLTHVPSLGYEVYEGSNLLTSGTLSTTSVLITLSAVDLSKTYTLRIKFSAERIVDRIVSLQNLYDTDDFENLYTFNGQLGAFKDGLETVFRLWAPLSSDVRLNLYNQGHPNYNVQGQKVNELTPYQTEDLYKIENGAWEVRLTGDYSFKYYTFSVTNNDITQEVTDPYAYSTGANGQRSMVVDFSQTNPEGWIYGKRPDTITNLTDYIVWELHVRDLTTHSSWNGTESYRGKFMGMTESGTTYTKDSVTVTTGLDHIAELGVNAVQLLPIFDFGYVDEIEVANNPAYKNVFNWGYMPYHFNTLEGSYSTNPFDGAVRINEFKQVVQAFHEKDIRIIMDVVYNHTGESDTSNFHKIVPGYYHRLTSTGGFSNGSGTGNETASERAMVRKFMVDSVKFWATEYNLSGFRFDLMELHDVETMNEIQAMLEAIDPTIVVYGEPWMGGTSPLANDIRAGKGNMDDMPMVGSFNDITRDAIKGNTFPSPATGPGWIQGPASIEQANNIRYGIVGGVDFPGIPDGYHHFPHQMINYVTAHDNNTLYDKLRITGIPARSVAPLQIQANAIVLTSQGIPFLHAGVEFMRSKPLPTGGYDHNSYESPDIVNQLRWDRKVDFIDVFNYYKALIQIRKTYNHFRMNDVSEIQSRISFINSDAGSNVVAFKIAGDASTPEIIVMHTANPSGGLASIPLTEGKTYSMLTYYEQVNLEGIEQVSGTLFSPANTSIILVEQMDASVSINEAEVTIEKGQTFDPLSNLTINNPEAIIYHSTYHDVNVPGRYTITFAVVETYGATNYYYYTLYVSGESFRVTIEERG